MNNIGSYKTNSNGVMTSYDKYGQKIGSFKKTHQAELQNMINTEEK